MKHDYILRITKDDLENWTVECGNKIVMPITCENLEHAMNRMMIQLHLYPIPTLEE